MVNQELKLIFVHELLSNWSGKTSFVFNEILKSKRPLFFFSLEIDSKYSETKMKERFNYENH